MRILRVYRGETPKDGVCLILSAFYDLLLYVLDPSKRVTLRALGVGKVISRFSGDIFYVRPGTDDIYSILPRREGDVHDAILKYLKEGDVFVDVGANVGYYTVKASKRVGEKGKVVAVEAVPPTAEILRKNVEANSCSNVEIVEKALWSEEGKEVIFRIPHNQFGLASAVKDHEASETFKVKTTTLDSICSRFDRIRLIKVDTEETEYEILKGAQKTLEKTDIVIVEAYERRKDIVHLLKSKGFEVRKMRFNCYIMGRKMRLTA